MEAVADIRQAVRSDKPLFSKGGAGGPAVQILGNRVCSAIFDGTGYIHFTGRNGCHQIVLIQREQILVSLVFPIVFAEPVGEAITDLLDGLAGFSPGEGCAAAAGIVRVSAVEAFIGGGR